MSSTSLLSVLEETAGQDRTESIMKHRKHHETREESMLHLVSTRMHSHAYRSNMPIFLHINQMHNIAQQVAYLAKVETTYRN